MAHTERRKALSGTSANQIGLYQDPLSGKTVIKGSQARRNKSPDLIAARDFAGSPNSADKRAERQRRNEIRNRDNALLHDDDDFDHFDDDAVTFESAAVTAFWEKYPELNRHTTDVTQLVAAMATALKKQLQEGVEVNIAGTLAETLSGQSTTRDHTLTREVLIKHFKTIPDDLQVCGLSAKDEVLDWIYDLLDLASFGSFYPSRERTDLDDLIEQLIRENRV